MPKEEAKEEEKTEFNSAIATLKRIDEIKKGLIIATVNQNYDMKFKYLKAFFLELIQIMDEKDDKAQQGRFKEVRKNYNTYRDAIRTGKKMIPVSIVDSFDDWEIELKNLEQKYNMGMPKQSDPRFAMAGKSRRRY